MYVVETADVRPHVSFASIPASDWHLSSSFRSDHDGDDERDACRRAMELRDAHGEGVGPAVRVRRLAGKGSEVVMEMQRLAFNTTKDNGKRKRHAA